MKKIHFGILIAVLLLSMCACAAASATNETDAPSESIDTTVKGAAVVPSESVAKITVSTLPESDTYRRVYLDPQKISGITAYIDDLTLGTDFPENPDEYAGMTWVITYVYEDGTQLTMYHFGNMFFRAGHGDWYRMTYEEASSFGSLIYENPGD